MHPTYVYINWKEVVSLPAMFMNETYHVPTTKSTLFRVSKDKWDTKEGPGKSMKNAL